MATDFDRIIDRTGTGSLKYDCALRRGKPPQALPMWVADMDFATPPCVVEALQTRAAHGIFGYTEAGDDYRETLRDWFERRFDWTVRPEWLVTSPGVVFALAVAVRAYTQPGERVLIQQPVYYPFASTVEQNGRELVVNRLLYQDGDYHVDFDAFEAQIVQHQVKLFILCSPHNPVGRVWTRHELARMGEICLRHGVLILSDEIHADFVYSGHRHQVLAGLDEALARRTITCTAPTKTFNLAGLQISNILIADRALRRAFREEMERSGYSQPATLGLTACQAAYSREGEAWLEELRAYLAGNLDTLRQTLQAQLPPIRLVEPQGTYLAWLDCSGLGLDDAALDDWMLRKAGLWLDAGTMFGAGGEGFQRINIACPRPILRQALEQLNNALSAL